MLNKTSPLMPPVRALFGRLRVSGIEVDTAVDATVETEALALRGLRIVEITMPDSPADGSKANVLVAGLRKQPQVNHGSCRTCPSLRSKLSPAVVGPPR